jgi:Mannosyltransferase (PIG-V)
VTTRAATTLRKFVDEDVRVALIPWAIARVLVVGALALSRFAFDEIGTGADRPVQLGQGLFAWDGAFYRDIAEHGYGSLPESAYRFFPLYPLLGRVLGFVLLNHDALALLLIANGCALVFAALLHRLALRETGDRGIARRAAWFAALFPVAMVLVMGYAESTFMLCAVGMFVALRRKHFLPAAGLGLLAALTRPAGVFLAIPALVEGLRDWRSLSTRERASRATAVVAPGVGMGLYLAWVGWADGDAFLPLRLQSDPSRRGGFDDPITRTIEAIGDILDGDRFGSGLHILWAGVFVVLLVVMIRRLPASYSWYAGVSLLVLLSAHNLDSFERYAMATFPFLLALALVTRGEQVERAAIALTSAGLVGYSILAFYGVYVP